MRTRTGLAAGIAVALLGAALGAEPGGQQHTRLFPPEHLGLLEGPDRDVWQRPDLIMDELRIAEGSVVADLGAGSGWFTIRLARRVGPNGLVIAEDIQRQMIEAIARRVDRENLRNVKTQLGTSTDPRLRPGLLDAALIVDAYSEMDEPVELLRNLARALKPGGRLGIVNFTKNGYGPGPPMEEKVDPDRVIRDADAAGLKLVARPDFLPFQYMLVFERRDTAER